MSTPSAPAAASPAETPPPLYPPVSPPPVAAPRPRRTALVVVVAAVVVVVVIVLALALAGVLPFFKGSASGPATFGGSRAGAQAVADHYPGGSWVLFGADGVASKNSTSAPTASIAGGLAGTGCTFTAAPGAPTLLTLSTTSDVSQGVSGSWLFLFKNASGMGVLAIATINGTATVIGSVGGVSCFSGYLGLIGTLGSNVIDSSTAASTANSNGGSTFLAAHPYAFATYSILAGVSFLGFGSGPQWTVTYSACPLNPLTTSTAQEFTATINATSGALTHAGTTSATCTPLSSTGPSNTPIGTALALGSPTEGTNGTAFTYTFSIVAAGGGLTLNDMTFQVQNSAGGPVAVGAATLYVTNLVGSAVASFSFALNSWTSGGSLTVTSTMSFLLQSPINLAGQGNVLAVDGVGSFTGSIQTAIP